MGRGAGESVLEVRVARPGGVDKGTGREVRQRGGRSQVTPGLNSGPTHS